MSMGIINMSMNTNLLMCLSTLIVLTSGSCLKPAECFSEVVENELGILISGGLGAEASVELFNPTTGQSCGLPSLPDDRKFHTSAGLEVCGGSRTTTSCKAFSFSSGKWVTSHSLADKREEHCSWETDEGTILLGGRDSSTTSETLKDEESGGVPRFNMHYKTRSACSIPDKVTNTLVITGGHYSLRSVSRYNTEGWMENLPSLNKPRRNHGCGAYLDEGGAQVFLVAGGYDGDFTDVATTELLPSTSSAWVMARGLPRVMAGLQGVTLPPGVLYMTGGYHGVGYSQVYQWSGDSWVQAGKMKKGRGYHAVSTIVMEDEIMQFCS